MRSIIVVVGLGLCGCGRPPIPQSAEIQVTTDGPAATAVAAPSPTFGPHDWPGWRGPRHDGVATGPAVPTTWSETENVVWRTKLPGRGHASPIIVGDRIYLETADEGRQTQSVMGIDRGTGKWLWQTDVLTGHLEQEMHAENTQASSTLATDGERLFALFLNDRRIYCSAISLKTAGDVQEGDELWKQEVGGFRSKFGYSASPIVYRGLVILAADHADGGFIAALDRTTGNIVWRRKRPNASSYASPRVVTMAGRDQVILCGCELVVSYDPLTGAELWQTAGTTEATVGTAVTSQDRVFVSGGYPGSETLALDGQGKVLWRIKDKCYVPSLLATDEHLYLMQDDGIARCLDAATGKELWKQRVGGRFRSSPLLAGGQIYVTNMEGLTTVFAASPQGFQLTAENPLGNEAFASPAVSEGRLYLRCADDRSGPRQEWLYCLGETTAARPTPSRREPPPRGGE